MIKESLLGRQVTVVKANNQSLIGITGECVDETKNTLRVLTDGSEKIVLKKHATIKVDDMCVEGHLLIGRSYERTKRKVISWQKTTKKQK
jgi:RNase P/RNase MRP subunit p29